MLFQHQNGAIINQLLYPLRSTLIFVLITILLSMPLAASGSFAAPLVQQYFAKDGLSTNQVEQIVEDKVGFIWIATSRGLNKFDGVNFVHYKPDPYNEASLNNAYIRCLYVDVDDNIWVGTKGGGLNYFDRKTGKFFHFTHNPDDPKSISHDEILNIFRDSKNRLWVGTEGGLNLFDEERKTFIKFLPDENDPYSVPANAVLKIFEDRDNNIWLGSWNGGLSFVEEYGTGERNFRFHTSKHKANDPSSIGSNHCWEIDADKNGVMWVGLFNSGASVVLPGIKYEKGKAAEFVESLKFLNFRSKIGSNHTSLAHRNVTEIEFTDDDEILFGTTFGLSSLDYSCIDFSKTWEELNEGKEDFVFINDHISQQRTSTFRSLVIRSIYKAKDGNFWFSTYSGIVKASNAKSIFQTHLGNLSESGKSFEIWSLTLSKYGYYLIGSSEGIFKYYPDTQRKVRIKVEPLPFGKNYSFVSCIHEDDKRNLWLGTHDGLFRIDANGKKAYNYSEKLINNIFFKDQKINDIYEDQLGHLWFFADFGIGELDPKVDKFTIHGDKYNDPYGLEVQGVSDVTEDENGVLWFSHLGFGLLKFERINGKNTLEQVISQEIGAKNNLASNFAKAIDYKDGLIWLGTHHGLTSYDTKNKVFNNYNFDDLNDKLNGRISSIGADNSNNIWISIESEGAELICFNHERGKISLYDNQHGLPRKQFIYRSIDKSQNGRLSFGSKSGFCSFFGESIIKQIDVPSVTMTNLSTITKSVNGTSNGYQSYNLSDYGDCNKSDEVRISHEQNQINIDFAVLDFRFANKFEYAYKLEGLHDDWMHIGAKNNVSFTGLAPGNYLFKVKAKNQDGYWSSHITSLSLQIEAPWYQTWLAYLGYAILLLLAVYGFYKRKTRIAEKEKIQLEMLIEDRTSALRSITLKEKQARIAAEMMKDEANDAQQRAESANLAKSQFLANMSHEIRTPMNGILGMLQLLNNTKLNTEQSDYVRTSTESALGLIRIINDILDFSKVESDKIEIEKENVDIHSIIENVIDLNAANCQEKHIEISYLIESTVPKIIVGDEVRIRQILTNLVSNAIKFTSRGEVSMMVSAAPSAAGSKDSRVSNLKFVVKDSGIGISKEKISQLFQAFSQVDASITRKFGGTGLGLAISRKLARLMNGDVSLESKEGIGTEVTFVLNCEFDSTIFRDTNNHSENMSAAIIDKSAVSGKSLVNMLESVGFKSFSLSREVTGELFQDLVNNPVDLLFVDSAYFTPTTEVLLNEIKNKTATKIILSTPILFPSLNTKCIDTTTAKPFKKSNVICTIDALLGRGEIHNPDKKAGEVHCAVNKPVAKDVFSKEFAISSPLKILVAEDHKINQMLIKKVLNKLGYDPILVDNGQLAIEESLKETYDVIFMDIQMPVLDGIGATKEILKNWADHQKPYIIAMTANAMKGDREKYISSGMHDYISKPFLINDLQNMLKKYSEKKHGYGKNTSLENLPGN